MSAPDAANDLRAQAHREAASHIGDATFFSTHELRERGRRFAERKFQETKPRGLRARFAAPALLQSEIEELWIDEARSILLANTAEFRIQREAIAAARGDSEVRPSLPKTRATSPTPTTRSLKRQSPPTPPAPPQYPLGVSHRGAETLVRDWMRHLGAQDAEVTRFSADGGIDVVSARWVAQVKNYAGQVSIEAVRELAGVASVDGRPAALFTSGGFTSGAVTFADIANIALFVYSAEQATLHGANKAGIAARNQGFI